MLKIQICAKISQVCEKPKLNSPRNLWLFRKEKDLFLRHLHSILSIKIFWLFEHQSALLNAWSLNFYAFDPFYALELCNESISEIDLKYKFAWNDEFADYELNSQN